jgi:hypothetical protein
MKGPKKISFGDEIFIEAKNALQSKLEKSKFDSFAAKLGNIRSLMYNYQKTDDYYQQMRIVKRVQRDTANLQKSLPKGNRSSLIAIQRVQNKMFGACQSSIAKELKDASMGDACWDIYVGKDDN